MQKTHETTDFEVKKFPLILVLDGVSGLANMGSLFRLADAFNIEKIIFCGTEVNLQSNRLRRTARATVKNVIFEEHENSEVVCRSLKDEDYSLVALEIAEESVPVESLDYKQFNKIALILGNENSGINSGILKMSDKLLHINMFGRNSSMNVTHAAGIALFEITKSLQPVR
ncbi:TrmH family RNA methyltransferase [Salinimicrobium xinjiangense]|uniref:TrmH family RNA methyltransferase n=1 Tax=Salinimicrobium xinjiangense TaxID=438596 RepID=UPI00040918DB|nr:TrmH family RNA methyltransferase [Salinimicrobium xinjiangense]